MSIPKMAPPLRKPEVMDKLLHSKKFWMAVLGLVVAITAEFGFDLSVEEMWLVLSPILAYILGQGIADFGKEKNDGGYPY